MATTEHGEPGRDELVALLSWGVAVAAAALVALLTIAFAAELLRRRRGAGRLVSALDRAVPIAVRTAVVSIVTLVTALIGARPAGGTDSVRGWLDGAVTTTTTVVTARSTTTVPTISTTTTTTLAAPPVLAPPVVLEPPVTPQDLEPESPSVAPAPKAPRSAAPVPAPPRVAVAGDRYVVVPGDCLWSIAEHRLGPGADARSIDAGWRAIYSANRVAIGDDPNLIHPGLTLTLPPLHLQP